MKNNKPVDHAKFFILKLLSQYKFKELYSKNIQIQANWLDCSSSDYIIVSPFNMWVVATIIYFPESIMIYLEAC